MQLNSINKSSVVLPQDINTECLIDNKICGCCSGKDFTKLTTLYEKPLINYIRCNTCDAVTFDRVYSDETIDSLYDPENYYDDYNSKGNSNITFYGAERIGKHIIKLCGNSLPGTNKEKISILDFGGGSGEIAYATAKELLKKNKYSEIEILVVDYEQKLYCSDDETIKLSQTFPLFSISDRTFDLVIASAVIEHLPNVGEIMRKLFELTAKNGILYFRTPYVFPLFNALKRLRIHLNTGFPAHIWDLGKSWWDDAPAHVGYKNGDIKVIRSKPAIVEKSFRSAPVGALISHLMKSVWYIFRKWPFVGGWEALLKKE
ncbi:MAG: methyltransferase domain-containing protein [Oscillospiraceae bacterium]|nr:methyltransferase domain-containing protein [Oscillospiraceae bacterium]